MSDVFKLLFNESIGDIRTHHTFIDGSKFLNTCYEAPIKEFLDGYVLHSRKTKKGEVYWYHCEETDAKSPEDPLKVVAKALYFQHRGLWEQRQVNPVFKASFWQFIDKHILTADAFSIADNAAQENSSYHLIRLIAQINLQVRVFDAFKKKESFTSEQQIVLRLLHVWYRTIQKQAVSHLCSHNLDIKDPATIARINGLTSSLSAK